MDKESDNYGKNAVPESREVAPEQLPDPGRRRFSRGAIVGSAVLLSLGNRAAWGGNHIVGCMSVPTLNSFNPATGMFISAPVGTMRPSHNEGLARKIHDVADAPDFLDSKGKWSTCEHPNETDSICLVKGSCN